MKVVHFVFEHLYNGIPYSVSFKGAKNKQTKKNTLEFAVRVKIINKISIIVSQKSVNYFENHIETITNVNESQISLQNFFKCNN